MVDNNERRAVAKLMRWFADEGRWGEFVEYCHKAGPTRMADLIEPPVKPDGAMEAWVNGLHHAGKAASVREIIEEMRNRRQIVRGYDYFIEMPRTLLDSIVSCIRKSCGEQAS